MESPTHPGTGIASCIIGIASAGFAVGSALFFGSAPPPAPGETVDVTLPVILFVCLIGALIALRLGIHGISRTAHRKAFAILGIAFSAATIVAASLAMGFGMGVR